jgi:hypothetical protein
MKLTIADASFVVHFSSPARVGRKAHARGDFCRKRNRCWHLLFTKLLKDSREARLSSRRSATRLRMGYVLCAGQWRMRPALFIRVSSAGATDSCDSASARSFRDSRLSSGCVREDGRVGTTGSRHAFHRSNRNRCVDSHLRLPLGEEYLTIGV